VCEWQHMTNINDDVDWQFQRDHMTSINSGVGMVSLQCGLMGSKTLRGDSGGMPAPTKVQAQGTQCRAYDPVVHILCLPAPNSHLL
jgi:hypothetical protein